ncbi:MAG: ABC transporter ATP-binding protein [candidate division WOR-3 bacterium]
MKSLFKLFLKWKKKFFWGILALLIVDAAQLILPLVIREVISAIEKEKEFLAFLKYSLFILLLSLFVLIFRFFWRYFILGAGREIEAFLRKKLYDHLLTLHPFYFYKTGTGNLMAHITNDLEAIRMASGIGIVAFFDFLIMVTFSFVIMFSISFKLTLYVLIPFPLLSVSMIFLGPKIHNFFRRVQERFSDLTESSKEIISSIKIIKSFVQEEGKFKEFYKENEKYLRENINLAYVYGIFQSMIILISGFSVLFLIIFGGKNAILGELSLGDFVAFISYLDLLIWPVMALGWSLNIFQRGSASLLRIELILKEKNDMKDGNVRIDDKFKGHIKVRNLNYSFNGHYNVLKNINLEIKPGRFIGFTGKPGSGKSTLLYLISRIYDPPDGTIFIDDIDIKHYRISDLRENIILLEQEPFIFSATIKENVLLGSKNGVREDEIEKALNLSRFIKDIDNFKEGIFTIVGERGVTLSGGQRERLSLARIFLRKPKILLIDDALSSLDFKTEKEVFENIFREFENITLIVVSTRIPVLMRCDEIYVFEKGEIVEMGTHEELVNRKGFYNSLYELQTALIKEEIKG